MTMPELLSHELSPDQLTIDTPEQVAIRFPIAGVGSRFLAIVADSLVQGIAYAVLILIFVLLASSAPKTTGGALSHNGEKWLIAGVVLFHFLLYWGYFALFETYWNGQTPGKRLCKIRVIQQSGRQITFFEAMTRNLIRVIDMLPGFYLIGVISMLCNRRNQRLGDLAAATIVIHERASDEPLWGGNGPRTITAGAFTQPPPQPTIQNSGEATLPADAVAKLTPEDLAVIDRFFSRILDMDLDTRARIAERLAAQMIHKMGIELPLEEKPERLLESIARQMRSHGR
ncbi:MAG: RDD family protein [Acidobacteriaceae bacterium]